MHTRRGFETLPPKKVPNSGESNKNYEIITKLQIKYYRERPILRTAFWPAANITNSGLAQGQELADQQSTLLKEIEANYTARKSAITMDTTQFTSTNSQTKQKVSVSFEQKEA